MIGSLCTGYAGLDMGVAAALGGTARLAWVADHDPHIRKLLTHRFPNVPNLGDLSAVRWSQVEQVDVITAGFPCQDVSAAGVGAGIEKGERSGVWFRVMDAVRYLRPSLLVLENVAALRWRGRGFDRVLADLARTGYDAHWRCVRASDIGAPHQRERIFVVAHPVRQRRGTGLVRSASAYAAEATGAGGRCSVPSAPHARVRTHPHCAHQSPQTHPRKVAAHTPGQRCHQRQPAAEKFKRAPHAALRGHRYPHRQRQHTPAPFAYAWGDYEPAIRQWERVLGRPAPAPTEVGTRGQPRLSAELVEWMMGLPEGWVTDPELGMPRRAQLQALGNGVVPQQATVAVRHLLDDEAHGVFQRHGRCCTVRHPSGILRCCRGTCGNWGSAG
ncbi:DNA cytosine methyltransferase [Nocardiopsis sp. NPDC006938]|uniref:DNA cytosine methyltransferase n=1 Tax=Nocardiopsis sp. NPDC006938 TaxID=3364337 RepID=UPI0036774D49